MPLHGESSVTVPLLAAGLAFGLQSAAPGTISFHDDVAPIIRTRCGSCHRPDGDAPFSLLSYADVRRRAALIADVIESGYMPPWKPEPGYGEFRDERRLPDAERTLLLDWIRAGAPEGDAGADRSLPGKLPEWRLGDPDLVITLHEPYRLGPAGTDVFRTFVVPAPVADTQYVRGIEFRPEAHGAIHHASIKIDRTRQSRQLDQSDPSPGYEGGGGRSAEFPDGHFLAWTPGQRPYLLPEDMAWRLDPNADLVIELHMMPTGRPELVRPRIGVFFGSAPATRVPTILRLGSQAIDIPAGVEHHVVTDAYRLPVDVEALAVQPHAHLLATSIRGTAELPDGTIRTLLYIADWDFRWQDVYWFRQAIRLPRGTVLRMTAEYDNSASNIRNPNRPPKRVTFGQTTRSEMGNLWIQVVATSDAGRAQLTEDHGRKLLLADIEGYEKMLESAPRDERLLAELGILYGNAGRAAEAVTALEEALRLSPGSAGLHHALGTILLGQRRIDEARNHLREAVRLDAGQPGAHNNLGLASHAQGRLADAVASYREALRLDPEHPQARHNLARAYADQRNFPQAAAEYREALKTRSDDPATLSGLAGVLAATGEINEAVLLYRRALDIDPDLPNALIDLAWILATSTGPGAHAAEEAVRLARRAADLTRHENPAVLEILGIAYFAAGRAPEAITTLRTALALASRAGAEELARTITLRLQTYGEDVPTR